MEAGHVAPPTVQYRAQPPFQLAGSDHCFAGVRLSESVSLAGEIFGSLYISASLGAPTCQCQPRGSSGLNWLNAARWVVDSVKYE